MLFKVSEYPVDLKVVVRINLLVINPVTSKDFYEEFNLWSLNIYLDSISDHDRKEKHSKWIKIICAAGKELPTGTFGQEKK